MNGSIARAAPAFMASLLHSTRREHGNCVKYFSIGRKFSRERRAEVQEQVQKPHICLLGRCRAPADASAVRVAAKPALVRRFNGVDAERVCRRRAFAICVFRARRSRLGPAELGDAVNDQPDEGECGDDCGQERQFHVEDLRVHRFAKLPGSNRDAPLHW